MTFLAPAWLLLAALAGVVVLLHARRRRRIDFPSVHIWRLIEQSTNRRRTLQRPPISLLMLLQLLVIAVLSLALAQPRFGTPDEPEHAVFLLDGSGSMHADDAAGDRFDAAKARLLDSLADIGDGTRVSILTVGAEPRLEIARQTDADGMRPIIEALRAGDGGADWQAAATVLRPAVRPAEAVRIVILSDDAETAAATIASAFPDATIDAVAIGEPRPNVALAATIDRNEDGDWIASGTVSFRGLAPKATDVSILFRRQGDDRFLDFGAIAVAPDEDEDVSDASAGGTLSFEEVLDFPGPGTVRLALPEDAGPRDNVAQFVLNAEPRRAQVLIVGAGDPYLNRAIAAVDHVDVFRSDTLPADVSGFDLIVVDDVAIDRQPETNVLWLERGRIVGEPQPPVLTDAYIVDWDSTHPLSVDVDWANIATPLGYEVALLDGATAIAEAADGPLVQARTTPYGREVVLALAANASGWVEDSGYPAFIANVIGWLDIALGTASPEPCRVGSACAVEARLLGRPVTAADGTVVAHAGLAGRDWLPPGSDRTFVPDRSGLYRVGALDIAVNATAPAESDLSTIAGSATLPDLGGSSTTLWWLLLLFALALLVAETWIAGRGSERFLQRRALARGTQFAGQRRWHLGLRMAALLAMVAGLLSLPVLVRESADATVAVVAGELGDGVTDERRGEVVNAVTDLDGRAGLVVAGDPAEIAIDIGGSAPPAETVATPAANLEEAVVVAAAMLRGDRTGRIVLAADGNQTSGELSADVDYLAAREIAVDVYPTDPLPAGEVLVQRVEVPSSVLAGDSFTLNAILFAEDGMDAVVTLLRNGEVLSEQNVTLAAGSNRIEAMVSAPEAGEQLYEVAVSASSDVVAANNRTGVIASVTEPPKTLIVASDPEWGAFFADALAVQGLTAEVKEPSDAPYYIDDWLQYDAVVLMNVPAIDLATLQQELLADYVEVHGHGLLILGGENAYGPGGYYLTDLERISPLSARVPQDAPGAAMMFVLDRSGSMQASVEDVNRLEIAKEATLNAISLLHEESQVGVIVFDNEPHVIVPMQDRKDEAAIAAALRPVEPGGGTKLFPSLSAAIEALAAVDAQAKHIVVMTDGLIEPIDFLPLLAEATEAGITISTVAIGGGADAQRAAEIARFGGGTSHATQDFRALPSILSQEAMMLSGTPVEVRTAPVFWVDRGADFLAGLPDQMPPLENYVRTTLRPNATLHLATVDEEDETVPVMASWRYGNGLVLALATHGAGSGTQRWLELPEYPLMWAQIIRHFASAADVPGLHASATPHGDGIAIEVAALDADGNALTGQDIIATPLDSDAPPIALTEVEPGLYKAEIHGLPSGTHRFEIASGEETTGVAFHVGYAAAYDFTRIDRSALEAFAVATGGSVLLSDPLAGSAGALWVLAPDWRPWAVLALALFLADLVVRYAPGLISFRRGRTTTRAATAGAPA